MPARGDYNVTSGNRVGFFLCHVRQSVFETCASTSQTWSNPTFFEMLRVPHAITRPFRPSGGPASCPTIIRSARIAASALQQHDAFFWDGTGVGKGVSWRRRFDFVVKRHDARVVWFSINKKLRQYATRECDALLPFTSVLRWDDKAANVTYCAYPGILNKARRHALMNWTRSARTCSSSRRVALAATQEPREACAQPLRRSRLKVLYVSATVAAAPHIHYSTSSSASKKSSVCCVTTGTPPWSAHDSAQTGGQTSRVSSPRSIHKDGSALVDKSATRFVQSVLRH